MENEVRVVVRKLLNGRITRVTAVKEIHNVLHGRIGEEELSVVLEHALSEQPELMVGEKRKMRRRTRNSTRGVRGSTAPPMGKRGNAKKTRRATNRPKKEKKRRV